MKIKYDVIIKGNLQPISVQTWDIIIAASRKLEKQGLNIKVTNFYVKYYK